MLVGALTARQCASASNDMMPKSERRECEAMMKKLGIVVMAGLFSVSVAGLSFADEKPQAVPATPTAPTLPDVGKAVKEEAKRVKKKAATMKEEATTAVTPPILVPAPAPALGK